MTFFERRRLWSSRCRQFSVVSSRFSVLRKPSLGLDRGGLVLRLRGLSLLAGFAWYHRNSIDPARQSLAVQISLTFDTLPTTDD
jgi:hypothetical protein